MLPHHKGLRPWPVIRLGLFLYDHLGGRSFCPGTRTLDLTRDAAGVPLKSEFTAWPSSIPTAGFRIPALWFSTRSRCRGQRRDYPAAGRECVHAQRETDRWLPTVEDVRSRKQSTLSAHALVNASGPWVSDVQRRVLGKNVPARVRLVKGSHIVVGKLFDHGRSYIFPERRRSDLLCHSL